MAGPAMIEGGGLGTFEPTEIGPITVQEKNGVVDIVADNEAHATAACTAIAPWLFSGPGTQDWDCTVHQAPLREYRCPRTGAGLIRCAK